MRRKEKSEAKADAMDNFALAGGMGLGKSVNWSRLVVIPTHQKNGLALSRDSLHLELLDLLLQQRHFRCLQTSVKINALD